MNKQDMNMLKRFMLLKEFSKHFLCSHEISMSNSEVYMLLSQNNKIIIYCDDDLSFYLSKTLWGTDGVRYEHLNDAVEGYKVICNESKPNK